MFISSWQDFDADVELAPFGGSYEPVPVPGAFHRVDWGRALGELSEAISEDRPHRATGAHAAHVVEILDAVRRIDPRRRGGRRDLDVRAAAGAGAHSVSARRGTDSMGGAAGREHGDPLALESQPDHRP